MVPRLYGGYLKNFISEDPGKCKDAAERAIELHEDEIDSLLIQLEEHLHRHPDQRSGYDALIALIEKNINEPAETLASVLSKCLPDSIPPELAFFL